MKGYEGACKHSRKNSKPALVGYTVMYFFCNERYRLNPHGSSKHAFYCLYLNFSFSKVDCKMLVKLTKSL